jgi:hypothetical protein
MLRITLLGAVGVILAMSLAFAPGASAAKEKRALEFMFEGPTGNEPVPVGDDVHVDSTGTIAFEVGPWTVECAQGALSGTVHEVAANEMELSLTSASVRGPGPEGACKGTAGNAYITAGSLPWANTLTTKHKATLTPEGEAKYLTFTLALTPEGRDEAIKCAYTASAVKSSFSKEEEPITLVSGRVTLKATKASDAECPKTGAMLEAKWSVKAAAPKSENFYPVVLNSLEEVGPEAVPAPPAEAGACLGYGEEAWRESECISGQPHFAPEVPSITRGAESSSQIKLASLEVDGDIDSKGHFNWGEEVSIGGTSSGFPAYGLQLNTNEFEGKGTGEDEDWVQFGDQVSEEYGAPVNRLCIEEWDLTKYYAEGEVAGPNNNFQNCRELPSGKYRGLQHANISITGYVRPGPIEVKNQRYDDGVLTVVMRGYENNSKLESHPVYAAVRAPDLYGLHEAKRWEQVEGSVYGENNDAFASFGNSTQVEVELGATSCKGYQPNPKFVQSQYLSEDCTLSEALKPNAFVEKGFGTGETSDLKPVDVGNPTIEAQPPTSYYPNKRNYAFDTYYVETTTGQCVTGRGTTCN